MLILEVIAAGHETSVAAGIVVAYVGTASFAALAGGSSVGVPTAEILRLLKAKVV